MKKLQDAIRNAIQKLINRETIAYLICGLLTTAVSLLVYWLSLSVGLSTAAANTASTIAGVLFAFIVNKIFVFRSESWSAKKVLKEFFSFCAGRLFTYAMETGLLIWLVDILGWHSFLCKCFTMGLVTVGNYIIIKWAVFNR